MQRMAMFNMVRTIFDDDANHLPRFKENQKMALIPSDLQLASIQILKRVKLTGEPAGKQ